MRDHEHAGPGAVREYPEEWGYPPGRRFSEERAQWVRKNVERHGALTAHRKLAARDQRLLLTLRRALLERRRDV